MKIDQKSRSKQHGFTLLEVTTALALLGIMALLLIPVFSQFLSSGDYLSKRTDATFWAYLKLEEIIHGVEKAQEGYCPEPWAGFNWRYHEEKPEEGIIRHVVTVKWGRGTTERKVVFNKVSLLE